MRELPGSTVSKNNGLECRGPDMYMDESIIMSLQTGLGGG